MSQIVNISLSPTDPNPGSYTVRVKDCSSSTYTEVAIGLTYSQFPFQFDVDPYITETCFDYQVIDTLSGCICTQQENIPDISPTPSTTPTRTPTLSNLPGCV